MGKTMKKYFWRDEQGYTAQNHAFLLFTTPYALFWMVAAVLTIIGIPIDPMFMDLLQVMQTPMMVVIGGIFSVNVATEFRKPRGDVDIVSTSQQSHGNLKNEQIRDYHNEPNQVIKG